MRERNRIGLPSGAKTLPAWSYTDPAVYRDELERFFFGMWVHAGRVDHVAETGAYVLRELGDESVVIVRGEGSAIAAFYNICRHRGTRLCTADGTFAGRIQCPYHAWTYDLSGRLVGAPHMEDVAGFRKEDYPLWEIGLTTWDGHIFLNCSGQPRPLADQVGDLPAKFRPWRMEELRTGARVVYDVRANWKVIVQNYSECLHCPIIHPAFQRLSHYLDSDCDRPGPGYLGGKNELRPGIETLSVDGRRRREYLGDLRPEDRRFVHFYVILPNLLLSLHPDYVMTHTLWPRAVDRTEVVCEWHFHREEVGKPSFDPADVVEFWDPTNRQDWHVSELTQLGVRSRAYIPGPYSDREDILYALDRLLMSDQPAEGEFPSIE
jgi:Rieske 2Fe-2S family protein